MNRDRFLNSIRPYITNPEVLDPEVIDSDGCQFTTDCNKCRLINCQKSKTYREGKR